MFRGRGSSQPSEVEENESILDDIGEDEDYSDDDDFDKEEVPPLEISSARRNRPTTATRRSEVSPPGTTTALPPPPPPILVNGEEFVELANNRRLEGEFVHDDSDDDPYSDDEQTFERDEEESEPIQISTSELTQGIAKVLTTTQLLLSPDDNGTLASRSITSESTVAPDDEYEDAEVFHLFDTATQSHQQMSDIAAALLASSSSEATKNTGLSGATISSSMGNVPSSRHASTDLTPLQRRQQEVSKKRAELLGTVYRQAHQLNNIGSQQLADMDNMSLASAVLVSLAGLQASLQDFVSSPTFSASECVELLLGPIIVHKSHSTTFEGKPPSVLTVMEKSMHCLVSQPHHHRSIVEAIVASLIVVLRHKDALLAALISDATREPFANSDATVPHADEFSSVNNRWGWLYRLFSTAPQSARFLVHERYSRSMFSDLIPHFAALTVFESMRTEFPVDEAWGAFLENISVSPVTLPERVTTSSLRGDSDVSTIQFWSNSVTRMFDMISTGQLVPPLAATNATTSTSASGTATAAKATGKQFFRRLVGAMVGQPLVEAEPAKIALTPQTIFSTPRLVVADVAVLILKWRLVPLVQLASNTSSPESLSVAYGTAALNELRKVSSSLDAATTLYAKDANASAGLATSSCQMYAGCHRLLVRLLPILGSGGDGAAAARPCFEAVVADIPTMEILCDTSEIEMVVCGHSWTAMIDDVVAHLTAVVSHSSPQHLRERHCNAGAHVLSLLVSALAHYYEPLSTRSSQSASPLVLLDSFLGLMTWGKGMMGRNGPSVASLTSTTPTSVLIIQNDVVLTLNSLLAGGLLQGNDSSAQLLQECRDRVLAVLSSAVDSSRIFFEELSTPASNGFGSQGFISTPAGEKTFKDALESSQKRRHSTAMLPMAASSVFAAPPARSPEGSDDGNDGTSSGATQHLAAWFEGVNAQSTVLSFAALSITNILQLETSAGTDGGQTIKDVLPNVFDLMKILLFPSDLLRERSAAQVLAPPALTASNILSMDTESIQDLTERVVVSAVLLIGSALGSSGQREETFHLLMHFAVDLELHLETVRGSINGHRTTQRRRSSSGQTDLVNAHSRPGLHSQSQQHLSPLLADVVSRVLVEPLQHLVVGYIPSQPNALRELAVLGASCARLMCISVGEADWTSTPRSNSTSGSTVGFAGVTMAQGRRFMEQFAAIYKAISCQCAASPVDLRNDCSDALLALSSMVTVLFDGNSGTLCARLHDYAFTPSPFQAFPRGDDEFATALRYLLRGATEMLSGASARAALREALQECDTPRMFTIAWRLLISQNRDSTLVSHVDYCMEVAAFFDALFPSNDVDSDVKAKQLQHVLEDLEMAWHREVLPWTILEVGGSTVLLPALQAIRDDRLHSASRTKSQHPNTTKPEMDSLAAEESESTTHLEQKRQEFLIEKIRFAEEQEATSRATITASWSVLWTSEIAQPFAASQLQRLSVKTFLDDVFDEATTNANKAKEPIPAASTNSLQAQHELIECILSEQRQLFAVSEAEVRSRSEILVEAVLLWQQLFTDFEYRLASLAAAAAAAHDLPEHAPNSATEQPIPLNLLVSVQVSPSTTPPLPLSTMALSQTTISNTSPTERILDDFESTMQAATQALLSSSTTRDTAGDADGEASSSGSRAVVTDSFSSPLVQRMDASATEIDDATAADRLESGSSRRAQSTRGIASFEDESTPTASLLLRLEGLLEITNVAKSGARQPPQLDECLNALRDARRRSTSVDGREKHRASRIMDCLESIKSTALVVIRAIEAREGTLNELHEFVAKYERNQQFFSAGLVDSIVATFLQEMKAASIKVVEATHAWRAANREFYGRWSHHYGDTNAPPTIILGDGSPGNDSLILPPSQANFTTDWSQNFNESKLGDASGMFSQAWASPNNASIASVKRQNPHTTPAPTVFLYKGVHYLHKMKEDLNFLSLSGVASYLHVEVNHNVVLMDKKRVVEDTITEPVCRGRNFFARLSAPKGTLAISRAAGHLDPDEYGIKELQKAAEDERSINVWFRSQTSSERQVIPPPPSRNQQQRAPTFNLFRVVVPHSWRRAFEEAEALRATPSTRPLSALAGPSSMEQRHKQSTAASLHSRRSPPSRPLSAALTRKEQQAAADKEAFESKMQMFESLSKTQPIEHESLTTVSKLRNRVKSIHSRIPSSADYQTRLTRRHPLQRFATVDPLEEMWRMSKVDMGQSALGRSALSGDNSHHAAGRAAAAAAGLRPPSPALHISLVASGLAVPSTVKARRGSIIEGARYSSTHLSASTLAYRAATSNTPTPSMSARDSTSHIRAYPLPPGWDGLFAVILSILFYRKVRQRALERCSATRLQKWFRRCLAQALYGKMMEDALAANSELMTWLMTLAESQRRRGTKSGEQLAEAAAVINSSTPSSGRRSSVIPRYSNAMQLFRYYSVAATKIQRQYRSRRRRITMLGMIGKLIAVLKMQKWARNMLDASRLLRASYLMRVGQKILRWMRHCRKRSEERLTRRRVWCAIHIQRAYRIGVAKAKLRLYRRRNNAAINIQRVVRGWLGRARSTMAKHVAVVLKYIKSKLWYRHLAQSFLHHEVSRRLKLAMSRTQSQKELERRRKEKAQKLRIYLKIDEAVVHRRAASRILATYRGWKTRKTLADAFAQQSQQLRQFASQTDSIAEGFHSMVSTSSSSSAVVRTAHQPSRHQGGGSSAASTLCRQRDDPSATWALARQLVREYTPTVTVLQCFVRKSLARMTLLRLRCEKRTRDVFLQAWKFNAKRLKLFRERCTERGRQSFMAALHRSQERRAVERRRQEELARQLQLLREKSATTIQSLWRMFTTRQDFFDARNEHMAYRAASDASELFVDRIVGAQRLVRRFLWMLKWSRVMRSREFYSARMIQMKWRKLLRRREELEEMYRHAHRVAEAAFKIQVWYRALSASKKMRLAYSDDDDDE